MATATLSGTITQYPRQPFTSYDNVVYTDGTVVRILASSVSASLSSTEYWRLFDQNTSTRWVSFGNYGSSTGISTDTTQYFNNHTTFNGEWAMLDLGERIFLDYYKIALGLSSTLQGRKPEKFRIYATNDSASWNNTKSGNWVQIQEVNDPSILRDGYTTFTVGNYQTAYRYYAIIINKIFGEGMTVLELREWELYGIPAKNKCIQYSWDIPPITLNQNGKISMEAKAYNTFAPTTIATTTTIKNIGSSKYNYSSKSNGTIIDASHWAYSKKKNTKCPAVVLQPQTINNISLSIVPEDNQKGVDNDSDFVAVLKITEDDLPITRDTIKIFI